MAIMIKNAKFIFSSWLKKEAIFSLEFSNKEIMMPMIKDIAIIAINKMIRPFWTPNLQKHGISRANTSITPMMVAVVDAKVLAKSISTLNIGIIKDRAKPIKRAVMMLSTLNMYLAFTMVFRLYGKATI